MRLTPYRPREARRLRRLARLSWAEARRDPFSHDANAALEALADAAEPIEVLVLRAVSETRITA